MSTSLSVKEHDRRALANGAAVQVIETLKHTDGIVQHSLVSNFPILGPDGRTALVGGMAIDITDHLHAEETLREADHQAQFAHVGKGSVGATALVAGNQKAVACAERKRIAATSVRKE